MRRTLRLPRKNVVPGEKVMQNTPSDRVRDALRARPLSEFPVKIRTVRTIDEGVKG